MREEVMDRIVIFTGGILIGVSLTVAVLFSWPDLVCDKEHVQSKEDYDFDYGEAVIQMLEREQEWLKLQKYIIEQMNEELRKEVDKDKKDTSVEI